jgi:predicted permease
MLSDFRYAFRQLLKSPGFTLVAVLSLALGIGANTAIFSLVNGILLGSLPVPYPNELRWIRWSGVEPKVLNMTGSYQVIGGNSGKSGSAMTYGTTQGQRALVDSFTYPLYRHLREQSAPFAETMGFTELHNTNVRARKAAFMADGLMVSENFFSGLGVQPLLGRVFAPGDDAPGTAPGVVISYAWWEREFALDPGALGQGIDLNGSSFTIVGVLPKDFHGITLADDVGFFVPMSAQPTLAGGRSLSSPDNWWVHLLARVRPGVGDAKLQAGFDVLFSSQVEGLMKEPQIIIRSGHAGPAYDQNHYRSPLLTLLSVVGLVIFVACANLAGLSLARSAVRQHEYAVRSALGSGRWRLLRQGLCESLLLAAAGGLLGLLLSFWLKTGLALLLIGPDDGLRYDTSLDCQVLGFTLAVSLLAALLTGLLPAWRASQVDPAGALKGSGTFASPRLRLGRILVIAQIALTLLLLAGAGLYVRTLHNLVSINPGFDTRRLLLVQMNPRNSGLHGADLIAFYERSLNELRKAPGVRNVTLSQQKLLGGSMSGGSFFTLPAHPEFRGHEQAHKLIVDEAFLDAMGIPLRVGRNFAASDAEGSPKVVVVNATFAKTYFGSENPLGQILKDNSKTADEWTVVGVCSDAKYTSIKTDAPATVYYSFRQNSPGAVYFTLRTAVPPFSIVPSVRRLIANINPDLPLGEVTTQEDVRDRKISQERTFALLVSSLAGLAVLLSAIGIYGLMAYGVARRTREIGLRMALGAQSSDISHPVLVDAVKLALFGVLLGLPAVLLLTRLIEAQLYGVQPGDPFVLGTGVLALFGLTALASWLPARRASRIDPMIALRSE